MTVKVFPCSCRLQWPQLRVNVGKKRNDDQLSGRCLVQFENVVSSGFLIAPSEVELTDSLAPAETPVLINYQISARTLTEHRACLEATLKMHFSTRIAKCSRAIGPIHLIVHFTGRRVSYSPSGLKLLWSAGSELLFFMKAAKGRQLINQGILYIWLEGGGGH